MVMNDGGRGPSAEGFRYRDRLEFSFSPSVIVPPSLSGDTNDVEANPLLQSAPIEIRFYDFSSREYADESHMTDREVWELQESLNPSLERFMEIKGLSRHWYLLKSSRYR